MRIMITMRVIMIIWDWVEVIITDHLDEHFYHDYDEDVEVSMIMILVMRITIRMISFQR